MVRLKPNRKALAVIHPVIHRALHTNCEDSHDVMDDHKPYTCIYHALPCYDYGTPEKDGKVMKSILPKWIPQKISKDQNQTKRQDREENLAKVVSSHVLRFRIQDIQAYTPTKKR